MTRLLVCIFMSVFLLGCGVKKPPTPILEGVASRIVVVTPTPTPKP